MKNKLFLLTTLISCFLFSQQQNESIPLVYDTSGYLENSQQPGTSIVGVLIGGGSQQASTVIPTVNAEMTVNSAGGLSYMLPIEVLKGINNFQPNFALAYNSQSGSGQAGWGWNITGLSVISEGGKGKDIDGITVGPQFDGTDPYYLDGQRLIKNSETEFVTEKFSKIKITKQGTGEFSFIVQYTDGKIAKYKEITQGQHYISVLLDALGNEIHYTYEVTTNIPRLKKVSYGGTSVDNDKFSIEFNYKTRTTPSKVYRNGLEYFNNQILDGITTNSSYSGLYRKYILTYDLINGATTERLRKIEIQNESGESLKPVQFDYNLGVANGVLERKNEVNIGLPANTQMLGDIVAGDFFGDGKQSTCYISKNTDGNFVLRNSSSDISYITTVGANSRLMVGKTLKSNKVTDRDQLIIAQTGLFGTLEVIDLLTGNKKIINTSFLADGTWHFDIITGQYTIDLSQSSDNFITGDFNNDGLTDLIHFIPGSFGTAGSINFYEIGKTQDSETTTIPISNPNYDYFGYDKIYPIELDGDGIPEIMFVSTYHKTYSVYKLDYVNKSLNPLPNLQNVALNDYTYDMASNRSTPLFFGDFNGDGLTDFMTPKKIYYIDKDHSSSSITQQIDLDQQLWWQYLSNGKTFVATSKDYTTQKLAYITPSQKSVVKHSSMWQMLWSGDNPTYEYTEYAASTIIPTDFNQDGKTDLIYFNKFGKIKYNEDQKLNDADVQNFYPSYWVGAHSYTSPNINKIVFCQNIQDTFGNSNFKTLDTVIFLQNETISPFSVALASTDFNQLNTYKSSLIISDPLTKKNITFTINNDSFTEGLIKKVDNGSGVDQVVEYRPMVEDTNTNTERCYTTTPNNWEYPLYVAKNNGTFYLVNKIHTLFDGKILTKEYRFENAIQKLDGKGFIGFQKDYVSDAYESELYNNKYRIKNPFNAVFWNIETKNPLLDNATEISEYGGLKKSLSVKTSINQKFDRGNHQYLILSTDETSTDNLKKISIHKKFVYDEQDDLKLKTAYTDYDGVGSSISKISYIPEFFNGDHYFYGKIDTSENITYKDGLSFGTKDVNTYYPNGLLKENQKYGNDASASSLDTDFDYYNDGTGNLKTQTISTFGIASQTTTYEYDSTKRYVNKTTTPDGLSATSVVNPLGRLLSEVSALGLTNSYTYDNWGNITTITDYLGKKTYISKSVSTVSGGVYDLSKKREGGTETVVTFDKFDREIQSKTQSINGKWIAVATEYDIFGKKTRNSEAFFVGETQKWNSIEYDELNRPVKNTSFTDKVITTCYEGMKVTTDDGYKKMSKTFDAMGHAVRMQDHGGVIAYSYYPNGALKETNYEGIKTTFEIDGWGNKTKITDPSAGIFKYEYDNLSRITKETTPKGYTLYTYDSLGRPETEKTYGNTAAEKTNIEKTYTYNTNTKLPETITGTSNSKAFTYTTLYDQYYRIKGKIEDTPDFTYSSSTTFDAFGKADVVTINTKLKNANYQSASTIKNVYDSNGVLIQQNDTATGQPIWHVSNVNAQGQTMQMEYGNGFTITNQYSADQMLKKISHAKQAVNVLDIDYTYDVNKGVLLNRNNNTFGKNESYEYDKQNRLIKETMNGSVANEYTFDNRGRITSNTELGKYNYNQTDYKLQNIAFNTNGQDVNTQRGFATITYNAFKSPLEISLAGKDDLTFDYNLLKTRYSMTSAVSGKKRLYTSDFAVEITQQGNKIEIITYITGDPYSANYIKREIISDNGSFKEAGNYYLHRDNLGSVLAITKADGTVVEKRYFDAWGNLKAGTMNFMDRGYTGHEHLQSVGLINMNARLYDPILRKFLSADNEISDPFNTQAYDRYGYVLNNPLLYIDQSGNNPLIIVAVFMLACDIFTHVMDNVISGTPVWYGLGKVVTIDAVSSAISFGIGAAVQSIASFALRALIQAGMHAVAGGLMSELGGGKFISGFAAGAISSLVSSGIEAAGTNFSGSGAYRTADGGYSQNSFGKSDLFKATMIVSGGLSGGLSSTIAGGNFFQGFKQGVIVAGLNHLAHMVADGDIEVDKATRKQFKSLVRDENYNGAFDLVNSKYDLDAGIEGKYTIDFPEGQQTPGLTAGEAFGISDVTISRSAFGGSVEHFIRVVHHEFVHVYQWSVLGIAGNLSIRQVREFLAYHDMFFNNKIPKASYSEMEGYWKKSTEFYDYMKENPTLIKAYQTQYNDFANSSFYKFNRK